MNLLIDTYTWKYNLLNISVISLKKGCKICYFPLLQDLQLVCYICKFFVTKFVTCTCTYNRKISQEFVDNFDGGSTKFCYILKFSTSMYVLNKFTVYIEYLKICIYNLFVLTPINVANQNSVWRNSNLKLIASMEVK